MAIDPLHAFYCRKEWLDLAQATKIKSGGVCARCGGVFDLSELRPHHITELTVDNVDNPAIALNPSNIEVVCQACHDQIHPHKYGMVLTQKRVYLIHGSPFAGKADYVKSVATRNDIVVDLEKIQKAICICGQFDQPKATKNTAFKIRDLLLDEIRTATPRRKWQNAYIIDSCADAYERERYVAEYGAMLIHIPTSKDECIARAQRVAKHQAQLDTILGWINYYWERFVE